MHGWIYATLLAIQRICILQLLVTFGSFCFSTVNSAVKVYNNMYMSEVRK